MPTEKSSCLSQFWAILLDLNVRPSTLDQVRKTRQAVCILDGNPVENVQKETEKFEKNILALIANQEVFSVRKKSEKKLHSFCSVLIMLCLCSFAGC